MIYLSINGKINKNAKGSYNIMDYFEMFLKKRKLTKDKLEKMMAYDGRAIKGTDYVCRFLHGLPRDTNIGLISDYDTDGLMSETVKYLGLSLLGFANLFISKRYIEKGYEFSRDDIDSLGDIKVLITSDVGINCQDAIAYAKQKGITVVVTDHHLPNDIKSLQADYIVNYRLDNNFLNGNTDVCGAYTVYQIFERYAQLYHGEISDNDKFKSDLVLLRHFAAIATVADAMPLLSVNHYIVKEMLHFMNYINPFDKSDEIVQGVCYDGFVQNVYNNFHIFINKLIGKSYNDFDMEFLEYTVIPAINSIKRMSADPMLFYQMLFNSPQTAAVNAEQLVELNEARKELVHCKMNELEEIGDGDKTYKQPCGKYIYMTTAPLGIAGLLAVKMMDKNGLPTVVLNDTPVYDQDLNQKVYKGSVRCPHTYPFLSKANQSGMAYCAGHECECGISVIAEKLHPFFDFLSHEFDGMFQTKDTCDINKGRKEFLDEFDIHMDFDMNIFGFEHDVECLVDDLKKYAPYGKEFELPHIILSFKYEHGFVKSLKENQHTKISLAPAFSCLLWNTTPEEIISADGTDTVYLTGNLSKSVYMGEWTTNFVSQVIS